MVEFRHVLGYALWGFRKHPLLMGVYVGLFAVGAVMPSIRVVVFSVFIDKSLACMESNALVGQVLFQMFLIVGCMFLSVAIGGGKRLLGIKVHNEIEISVLSEMTRKVEDLQYSSLESEDTQALLQRVGKGTAETFFDGINNSLKIISYLIEVIGFAGVIAAYSWYVSIIIAAIAFPILKQAYESGAYEYEVFEEAEENMRKIEYYEDVLTSRRYTDERKLFSFNSFIAEKWNQEYDEYMSLNEEGLKKISKNIGVTGTATNLIPLSFGLLLLVPLSKGGITPGVFVSLLAASFGIVKEITVELYWSVSDFARYCQFYEDYSSFLRLPTHKRGESARVGLWEFKCLEMRNLSFSYPGAQKKVLNNLNLKFERGQRYALVGENGSGKTTIVKLLLGLYEDYEGEILIDGVELREIPDLSGFFSVAFQDFYKYEIRVKDFLSFGKKKLDVQKAAEVLNDLGIDPRLLDQNPYLGKFDESSHELSGGQWQKLLLARILLDDAPFKILDEPTASIDPLQEAKLYAYFDSLSEGESTSLLITHRLGASVNVKNILVLDEGRIVEAGSHHELMANNRKYAGMFNAQKRWYHE